ncbi:hypothetical protein DM02DRAFT_620098, partial [Periconia macrospinosa]
GRRRPALACEMCRRRKVRCNRESPCNNCIRSKVEDCVYKTPAGQPSNVPVTPPSDIESMKMRIKELEMLLQGANISSTSPPRPAEFTPVTTPGSHVETVTRSHAFTGTIHIHHGDPRLGQTPVVNRSISHKNRMFGGSHWYTSCAFLMISLITMIDEHLFERTYELVYNMQKCKHLAKLIKARWTPEWPCSIASKLPTREVADVLLEHYFSTVETFYRVLHQPSFRKDYEAVWEPGATPEPTFLVLLNLTLAIGAAVYDDRFTLRSMATRWVYEAETWLTNPTVKHRLNFEYFQISILLLLARELVGVSEDLNWISAGSLLRTAIHFGLHRDPLLLPNRTLYDSEMHRRLWNTILEICLQTSLNIGGPPLLSLEDFDTPPPGNFNDEQLTDDGAMARPDDEYTDSSVARELRNTFSIRLSIVKFLNCIGTSGTYEDTLRLDSEFRSSYKNFRQAFQTLQPTFSGKRPHANQAGLVNLIMLRYLVALHSPFFEPSLNDPAYAISRKITVESSLKMWYTFAPPSTVASNPISPASESTLQLQRMIKCGSGFFRYCMMQTLLIISVELREQIRDDDGLGLIPLRPDLFCIVREGVSLNLACIEAGETNIKGYLFINLIYNNIEGLSQGLSADAIASLLASNMVENQTKCFKILQNMLASNDMSSNVNKTVEGTLTDTAPARSEALDMSTEDWDFTTHDPAFDVSNFDLMAWMFESDVVESTAPW